MLGHFFMNLLQNQVEQEYNKQHHQENNNLLDKLCRMKFSQVNSNRQNKQLDLQHQLHKNSLVDMAYMQNPEMKHKYQQDIKF